jgi:hypothetical protein
VDLGHGKRLVAERPEAARPVAAIAPMAAWSALNSADGIGKPINPCADVTDEPVALPNRS